MDGLIAPPLFMSCGPFALHLPPPVPRIWPPFQVIHSHNPNSNRYDLRLCSDTHFWLTCWNLFKALYVLSGGAILLWLRIVFPLITFVLHRGRELRELTTRLYRLDRELTRRLLRGNPVWINRFRRAEFLGKTTIAWIRVFNPGFPWSLFPDCFSISRLLLLSQSQQYLSCILSQQCNQHDGAYGFSQLLLVFLCFTVVTCQLWKLQSTGI